MRQIVLDTETTGLEPEQGHRIIEIGCVELINRRMTGNNYHHYIHPEREIDEAAVEVHGITLESLEGKPLFGDLAEELLEYLKGAELIIHNAPFDVAFLNHEFTRSGLGDKAIEAHCEVMDTLVMARHKHPGQRNSLDALCKRYEVDNSQRQLHGALLDAEILADVYLVMTGGQISLLGESEDLTRSGGTRSGRTQPDRSGGSADEAESAGQESSEIGADSSEIATPTPLVRASEGELSAHEKWLQLLEKESPGGAVWRRIENVD